MEISRAASHLRDTYLRSEAAHGRKCMAAWAWEVMSPVRFNTFIQLCRRDRRVMALDSLDITVRVPGVEHVGGRPSGAVILFNYSVFPLVFFGVHDVHVHYLPVNVHEQS